MDQQPNNAIIHDELAQHSIAYKIYAFLLSLLHLTSGPFFTFLPFIMLVSPSPLAQSLKQEKSDLHDKRCLNNMRRAKRVSHPLPELSGGINP
jgi:hypothetical protein